jgi:hypothetical protein
MNLEAYGATSDSYDGRSGGFSPPPGPLPRRYGPRPLVGAFRRLVLLAIIASGLLGPARDLLSALEIDPLLAAAVAVGALGVGWALVSAARRWERRRSGRPREVTARAVRFTHRGLRVHRGPLMREEFGWGEVVGLVPPREGEGWSLEARRGGRKVMIRFPEDADWARELVGALRDRPAPAAGSGASERG